MLPKLKEEREELKEVNANCRWSFSCFIILYNNLKALAELKKKGKKVGKLRYKYGKFRSFMNQSSFKIETGSRLDMSSQRWERFL